MNTKSSSDRVGIVLAVNKSLLVSDRSNTTHYIDSKKFVTDISKLLKNVKGVIFCVFDHQPIEYITNMNFCEAVKEKLDSLNIKYYFESTSNFTGTALLIASNTIVKFQEIVCLITAYETDVVVVQYNKNDSKSLMKCLRIALKSKKLIVFENSSYHMNDIYVKEITKWFMDKSYTKFYILPTCARHYFMTAIRGSYGMLLFMLDTQVPLPYKNSFNLSYSTENVTFGDRADKTSYRSILLEEKCHGYKITVSIDTNNFIDVKYEAIVNCEIYNLPKCLNEKFEKNSPVIGIMGNLSVICIPKNDGYEFLNAWNGLYGKELVVNFEEEKPKFELAHLPGKGTFVVYDLIEIMSLPIDKICNNEKWTFTFTENDENPVLLEFDNYDGTKKAASPAFLMAMLFKQQLKAIKKETGIKPAEIGICLLQEFDADEKKRVEEQLEESCKLLKIDCVFINV